MDEHYALAVWSEKVALEEYNDYVSRERHPFESKAAVRRTINRLRDAAAAAGRHRQHLSSQWLEQRLAALLKDQPR